MMTDPCLIFCAGILFGWLLIYLAIHALAALQRRRNRRPR